jgi:uncharacterized FlaG/YvyC family protein
MSPIGRILIVVNLLLAAAFLGWASNALNTSTNYKQQLEDLEETSQAEKAELDSRLAQANAQLEQQRTKAATETQRADENAVKVQSLQTDLDEARADNDALRGEVTGMNSRLDDLARSVDASTERAAQEAAAARDAISARDDAEDAQREAERAQADAEKRASDLARTVETLNGRIDGLNDELGTANNRLDAVAAMTGINIADVMDVPPLNKDVIAVNMDLAPGFVSINAGSGDGVRRGMVFQIYRGATYKGEVRVESVTEGACAAVVTTSVDGTQIMTGDSATTAL